MKEYKKPLKYQKERTILSDTLPFEIPVTFSNRHLYHFLVSNKVEMNSSHLVWKERDITNETILRLLFGVDCPASTTNKLKIDKKVIRTIPFKFRISHKEDDFRELSLIHPINLIALVEFYENYKHLIIHYCNVSPFSIRKASKIAKFIYHNDDTHKKELSTTKHYDSVEEHGKEYDNLKTYFVYKKYSNIYKFYESYKYHYCEKKYNKLFKFDISKCFDSIYTHTISWAILNKELVKDDISKSNNTFSGHLDSLMQNLNHGETNGIVIGPEFSRMFAELILQKIDRNVEISLRKKENLLHKVNYEIFRYVDDFFVFYNDEITKDKIFKEFRMQLREYKLAVNDNKTVLYNKPLITEITIAKQKISDLLNDNLSYIISIIPEDKLISENIEIESPNNLKKTKSGTIQVDSNRLITIFKTIIKESNVSYKDILNYTFSIIERKIIKIFEDYLQLETSTGKSKSLTRALLETLDFTFFIYSVSPRVNTTIKLCRILRQFNDFFLGQVNFNIDQKHLIYKKIFDNIYFILQKNKSLEHTQIETLYLLIALGELGKEYWLDVDMLRQYLCIDISASGQFYYNGTLNYFTITVLLFYMKNKKRYNKLRDFILEHAKAKFSMKSIATMNSNAELVYLLFDLISCPYIDSSFKSELLSLHGIYDLNLQNKIINKRKFWFTKWTGFKFGKELDAKISVEVY